jgi:hypothetical protein
VRKAEGVAFFQTGGMAVGLWPRDELAKDARVPEETSGFVPVSLALNTYTKAEVDDILAEAARAGARITKPAQDTFYGGYAGYFADPDGFLWEIAWNPGFELTEDGSLRLPD